LSYSPLGRRFRGNRGSLYDLFGQVGLRLRFGFQVGHVESVQPAQSDRHVFVDGAGVRFLLDDSQFREPIQNLVSLDFQLSRQLVDSNLLHRKAISLYH